jgi:ubiquinone/menaquinone biosynthesis C-methylase UbiE
MKRRLVLAAVLASALAAFAFTARALVRSDTVDQKERSRLVEILDVDPGETVADVGAGDGRYSVELAEQVGESGRVYASEVDPAKLKEIEDRVRSERLRNVEVVRGTQESTGLPDGCCSAILLRRVYHHFQDPSAMQSSLRRALGDGGLLLVIDFAPRPWGRPEGVPASRHGHGIEKPVLVSEMEAGGFELVKDEPWPNGDYALLFRATR